MNPGSENRYARQVAVEGVGPDGQARLARARVLVVGAGGLGSAAIHYLAASGVGSLGILDDDRVEVSNLPRQVIYAEGDLGRFKARAAAARARRLNRDIEVIALPRRLSPDNASRLIPGWDFVLDCTDNFASRFLVNDTCVAAGVPFAHGAVMGLRGQALTSVPGSACYRCLFREAPPEPVERRCLAAGVLGVAPGLVGVIQAAEALRFILGAGRLLVNRLLVVDLREMVFREVPVTPDPGCSACRRS